MSQARHTPLRTCRVCRTQRPKQELERWVLQEGKLVLDSKQHLLGRGIYSCRSVCSSQIHHSIKRLKKSGAH